MSRKVLVVDDEKLIVKGIRFSLEQDGMDVDCAYDGEEALKLIRENKYNIILLDVMLPKLDGFQVCQQVREFSDVPIVMLTAKGEDMDKILGLEYGADDYITKPFNPLELMARVKTQLRRYTRYNPGSMEPEETLPADEIDIRGLQICKNKHKCTLNGVELNLTPIEFDILWYLCEHQGTVVSSEELFEAIWKEKYLDNNNTVMTHIARLREKMQEPARKPKYVKTVWGVGYTIE